ncbi:MAG: FtsQ-type POTRA domain-containing protein [Balneolales bacterium]
MKNIFRKKQPDNVNRRMAPSISKEKRVREPRMAFPYMTHLTSAMTLVIIVMVLGWNFNRSSKVDRIEVIGNYFTETDAIIGKMAIPGDVRVDSLDFLTIMENVESMPYIRQAFINRSPSGNLRLRVEEREPLVLLIEADGRTYVDREGIPLPVQLGKSVDVPLLYATLKEMESDTLHGPVYSTVAKFLGAARDHGTAHITISEIAWSGDEGVVALSHDNAYRLVFGTGDFKNRINSWMVFYSDMILDEGVTSVHNIDLRFEGQIVTR